MKQSMSIRFKEEKMTKWTKGNTPPYQGWYWTTVDEAGTIKMYDIPMRYENKTWFLDGKPYFAENIVAWVSINKPNELYGQKHIGFPDQYYIRVKINGIIHYLSKGLQSVKWSKIGYATKEKATAAAKRLRKIEPEYGYQNQKTEIVVVNGNGEEI